MNENDYVSAGIRHYRRQWQAETGTPVPRGVEERIRAGYIIEAVTDDPESAIGWMLEDDLQAYRAIRDQELSERTPVYAPEPPEWWKVHSRKVLSGYLDHALLARLLLSRAVADYTDTRGTLVSARLIASLAQGEAVDRADVAILLRKLATHGPSVGDELVIHFPGDGESLSEVHVRNGVLESGSGALGVAYIEDESPDEHANPLFQLAQIIRGLHSDTGLPKWQATVYLLCGEMHSLPWVEARTALRSKGEQIVITVGSSSVPFEDVANAYRMARGDLPVKRALREVSPRRMSLYTFGSERGASLDARAAGGFWESLYAEWEAQPDCPRHYPNKNRFAQAWRRSAEKVHELGIQGDERE